MNKTITMHRFTPLVILMLIAVSVLLFALLVIGSADDVVDSEQSSTEQFKSDQVFEWKLVTSWPKNFPGLGTAPERFAEIINTISGGRLSVKVYGAGELVPALGVFDAVSLGSVEMGHSAAYYWKGKAPAAFFFTAVPFGLTAQETNGWLYYGGGMELWREVYEPFNIIPLAGGNTGVQLAGWFNKEINSLEDLKGLKMRLPGVAGEVLKRAGGTAVTIPGGELYTSLQTGVIDATEWVGPYNDLALGLHEVAKYYYYPGWHEPGAALELIVNKNAYNSLPKDLQLMVETVARAVNQDMLDLYTARNNAALVELSQKHQVQLRRFPDEVVKRLHQLSDQVLAEMASKDPMTMKVYESYTTFLEGVTDYHHISEQAYINARDL